MSFPRYPKYKDSGVEWLGEVPEHWTVCALSYRYEVALGKMLDEKRITGEHLAPYLRNTDVQWNRINVEELPQMDFKGDDLQRYGLRNGDLLVCEGGDVGRAAIWDAPIDECYYQKALHRVRPADVARDSPAFLCSVFRAANALGVFSNSGGKSTIAHLTAEDLRRYRFPFPPVAEQRQIAEFLSRETGMIDGLVAEQQRLMELLKEKRQAVISHAVTKGLNPRAPMKPSGIEWLGDVPEHWEIGPLKRYWSAIDCKHVTAEFVDDGIPVASIREVQSRWVDLENAKQTTEHFYDMLIEGGRRPEPGDLIFSRNATVGEVAQVSSTHPRFALGQDVVLLRRLSADYSSDYLQHVIRSQVVVHQLANMMVGSTFKRVNVEEIRSLILPFPPPGEQKQISAVIEANIDNFDALAAEAQKAIDLLQERRTALISAAVTGQIDVRKFAAA